MSEGKIMALTGIIAGVLFLVIPFPFSVPVMGVVVGLGMLAIHKKQKARIAKSKISWEK